MGAAGIYSNPPMIFLPTAEQLRDAVGCSLATAQAWAPVIVESCAAYDITGPFRLPAYLATIGHESAGLSRTVENLNYSAQGLMSTWQRRFTAAQAKDYARQPQRIANHVYGGRMGNGPESSSNDGWLYRGRGLIQVTGKANYEAVRDLLRERFEGVPDFVADPGALAGVRWSAWSAAAIWHDWGLNGLADKQDFLAISRRINLGSAHARGIPNGMADRKKRWQDAQRAIA